MYGEGDLAESPIFQGGYCNFGYWYEPPAILTIQIRVEASRALYRYLLDALCLGARRFDEVIEIGAGRGHGARLALDEFAVQRLTAIDQSPHQVARLCGLQSDLVAAGKLRAMTGSASALPLESAAFDALYSVEALQHIVEKSVFLTEARRVLRPGGRLALTTFFLSDTIHADTVRGMLPTVANGITRLCTLDALMHDLEQEEFGNAQVQTIGAHVFPGFDRWLAWIGTQGGEAHAWGRNWLRCYDAGLIDYHLVVATKREHHA